MSGIVDLIIPKEKKFFEFLGNQVLLLAESSLSLEKAVKSKKGDYNFSKTIRHIDWNTKKVGNIQLEIISGINNTFITPIDREDIKALSSHATLIAESINETAVELSILDIEKPDKNFIKQVELLNEATGALKEVFIDPLSARKNHENLEKMKDIEREADHLYRKSVGELFRTEKDVLKILKQKELYKIAEKTFDKLRRMAELLETVIISNS